MGLQYQIKLRNGNHNQLSVNTDTITEGQVIITAKRPTTIYGIGLHFEGKATALLQWKTDSKVRVQRSSYFFITKPFNILQDDVEPEDTVILFPNDDIPNWNCRRAQLERGKNIFPFHLLLGRDVEDEFPEAFKHDLGYITYKLVIFLKLERAGPFTRQWDLHDFDIIPRVTVQSSLPSPKELRKTRNGTDGNNSLEGTLRLSSDLVLPGEEIQFSLKLVNPSGGRILSVSVILAQKLGFYVGTASKSEFKNLCVRERSEVLFLSHDFEWSESLQVPLETMLSFKTKEKCLEIFYFVQFTVNLVGNGTLQGEIPVRVVSHILPPSLLSPNSNGALGPAHPALSLDIPPPPSYAELLHYSYPSPSCETLPPAYEDIIQE